MYWIACGGSAGMKIDIEKIQRYLGEIKARHNEIEELLQRNVDTEILKEPWVMKGLNICPYRNCRSNGKRTSAYPRKRHGGTGHWIC